MRHRDAGRSHGPRDLPGDQRSQTRQSINAGMDMVMVPERYKQFYAALKNLAETGEVPMTRIDDAVKRILRVKFAMGLVGPSRSPLADRSLQKDFGSPARREVARRAQVSAQTPQREDRHG